MKKWIAVLLTALMLLAMIPTALADGEWKVSLGNDLTADQRNEALNMLGVNENEVQIFTITIDEEKALLGGKVDAEKLGSRSLSCISIRPLAEGEGINVTTQNITWVTEAMYASAMATAGIKDAEVKVACPLKVSGTAALAGIFKAYEATSGALDSVAKDTAASELVTTGELGDVIGMDEATKLIALVKEQIIANGYDDPAKVREVVLSVAKELGIELTDAQVEQIVNLVVNIATLDIDPEALQNQLNKINAKLRDLASTSEQALGFVQSIKNFFAKLLSWLTSLGSKS